MKKTSLLLNFLIWTLAFFSLSSLAITVSSELDREKAGIQDSFTFSITVSTSKDEDLSQVQFPRASEFSDAILISRSQRQANSIQIINSRQTVSKSLTTSYRLQAKRKGVLKIHSLNINYQNQTFNVPEKSLEIVEGSLPEPQGTSPGITIFGTNPLLGGDSPLGNFFKLPDPIADAKNIILKTNVNKVSFYKGERVDVDWFMLSLNPFNSRPNKNAELKGFLVKERERNQKKQKLNYVTENNTRYLKTDYRKLWLYPLRTGDLEIDPHVIEFYSRFGFSQRSITKAFPRRKIKVKALPEEGKTKSFTGAVGQFRVWSEIPDKTSLKKVNEPFAYKIHFKGRGHPDFISLPKISFFPDFESYPPVDKSSISEIGEGTKEFEILLIPQKSGKLIIPSMTLLTFDPDQEKYIPHTLPSLEVFVGEGDGEETKEDTSFLKKEKKKKEVISIPSNYFWPEFLNHNFLKKFWLGLFLFLFLIAFYFQVMKINFKRSKTLKKDLNKKIQNLKKLMDNKEFEAASVKMIELSEWILQQVHMNQSSYGWRQALEHLPPSLKKKYKMKLESLFHDLESVIFSKKGGKTISFRQMDTLFKQTKSLCFAILSDLEL